MSNNNINSSTFQVVIENNKIVNKNLDNNFTNEATIIEMNDRLDKMDKALNILELTLAKLQQDNEILKIDIKKTTDTLNTLDKLR